MSRQRKAVAGDRSASRARPGGAEQIERAVTLLQTIADEFQQRGAAGSGSPVERRRLQAYLFGMLLAHGKQHALPPPAVLGAMTLLLATRFGLAAPAAEALTRELLAATAGTSGDDAVLIRRGIAGLERWTQIGPQSAVNDFGNCVARLGIENKQ